MTAHVFVMPTRLQRPQCSCGWTPDLPWPVSWQRYEADVAGHLGGYVACSVHGVQERNGRGHCRGCASDHSRRSWATRRKHYPKGTP